MHHQYIYHSYLQIAAIDITRSNHPALWYITWDPSQSEATRPLAIRINGTWYAYGWDLTKNVCELYGQNGYIQTAYTYTPNGEVISNGNIIQPMQWSSEYFDNESGIVYFNYRYYNPREGRWICYDPVGIRGGYNLYKYFSLDKLGLYSTLYELFYVHFAYKKTSFTRKIKWIIPISPPAVTLEPSIEVEAIACDCCDKKTGQYETNLSVTITGELDIGMGTSIGGLHYDPRIPSKFRDPKTGRLAKKPELKEDKKEKKRSREVTLCPEDSGIDAWIVLGVRGFASVGVGLFSVGFEADIHRTFKWDEPSELEASLEPTFGEGTGARISAYVQVAGSGNLRSK